jgi:hypothetical protein
MSGGVSESSEVDSMQTMRSTRRLRPMYRRRDPAALKFPVLKLYGDT